MDREVSIARTIAMKAHAGQTEESTGDPYICHVGRVADFVEGDKARAAAWLHDVLEDDDRTTPSGLMVAGISQRVIDAVCILTRDPVESYEEYISRIKNSGDVIALAVKIADLKDHFRPGCPPRLLPRYRKAWAVLCPGEEIPGKEATS